MRRSACLRSANGTKATTKASTNVKLPKLRSSNRATNNNGNGNGTKRFDYSDGNGNFSDEDDSSGDDQCNQKFISLVWTTECKMKKEYSREGVCVCVCV